MKTRGRQNPVAREIALDRSPVEVARAVSLLEGAVFLDSALAEAGGGRISIVAAEPSAIHSGHVGDAAWRRLESLVHDRQLAGRSDLGLPGGGALGRIGYAGEFCFGIYEDVLVYEHGRERWLSAGDPGWLPAIDDNPPRPPEPAPPIRFRPALGQEEFCAMVRAAKEYIAAGDIYQVNLTHRFEAEWAGDAFSFYECLRHYSPAPYAAYLDLGGCRLLSSSPELFLRMSGRAIRTRPIKGTRPRRGDPAADERSAYDLITSGKEVAELIMITDLERNDLGQVCEFGSVQAKELLKLERFEQVFHLVSTVDGILRPDVPHLRALEACFPGGSITGAPKKRAREIIAELEPTPRGAYTGAIGYFGFNGESQFNIAIRTVAAGAGTLDFHVGAGIVADSIPEREWQETLDKAAGILLAAERYTSAGS